MLQQLLGSVPLAPHLDDVRDALVSCVERPSSMASRFICIRGPHQDTPFCFCPAPAVEKEEEETSRMVLSGPMIDKSVGNHLMCLHGPSLLGVTA